MVRGAMVRVGISGAALTATRSGVGRYVACLLGALGRRRAGMEFACVFGPPRGRAGRGALGRLRPWVKALVPRAYELAAAARALRLRGAEFDLFHETNHVPPEFAGPVVVTVHDLSVLLHPETQPADRVRFFAREMPRRVPRAARVIVPTEAIKQEVVRHLGLDPARVDVVPHGVDARFRPGLARGAGAETAILYVGNLEPRKGIGTLVEAYRALSPELRRQHALVLCGDSSRLDRKTRALIDRPAAPGRIEVPGWTDERALRARYRAAAVVAYPSTYEGFGLPVLEAMACGVPVVCSDIPALREVAGGATLLVPPGDPEALAAALTRSLEDEPLARALRTFGLARAREFSWRRSAELHVQSYRRALGL
jgi:alpha-1,3-rhamnosyl/mannosyltransferase